MENFTIKTTLTEKDLVDYYVSHVIKRPAMIFIFITGLLFVSAGISDSLNSYAVTPIFGSSFNVIYFGSFEVLFVLLVLFIQWRKAKQGYRTNIKIQKEIEYTFSDASLSQKAYNAESTYLWDELFKLKISKKLVIIYVSKNLVLLIPTKEFSNEQLNFLALKIKKK